MRPSDWLVLIQDAREILADAMNMGSDEEFLYACKEEVDMLESQYAIAYVAKIGYTM